MSVTAYVIIDTCVAASIGEHSSRADLLEIKKVVNVLESGPVGVLMTPALLAEWRRHASKLMVRWLAVMQSKRRVLHREDNVVRDFRIAISRMPANQGREAILKDAHVTEAAILTGSGVLSTDDKQRRLLARLATDYSHLANVQWLNPATESDAVIIWLSGCCTDQETGRILIQ